MTKAVQYFLMTDTLNNFVHDESTYEQTRYETDLHCVAFKH